MSIHLTRASSQTANHTSAAPNYNGAYTITGWVRFTSLAATTNVLSVGGSSAGADYDAFLWVTGTALAGVRAVIATVATTQLDGAVSTATWYAFGFRRTSATALELWLGTTAAGLALVSTLATDVTARGAAASIRLGVVGASTNPLDGDLTGVKAWNGVALTQAQMIAELSYHAPVIVANLWAVYKLPGHTDLTDSSGNGRHLSAVNGPLTTGTDPADLLDSGVSNPRRRGRCRARKR